MTRIKLCGLSRTCDIEAANELKPEFIGFVFYDKSKRYVTPQTASALRRQLIPDVKAVGVFVGEAPQIVVGLLNSYIIDIVQLHGGESEEYIRELRKYTDKPIIKAFRITSEKDVENACRSTADYILLDSGSGGTGAVFDWSLIRKLGRPYFLAGGLHPGNVGAAVESLLPYAVDVSSGVEIDGLKDREKMAAFVAAVRRNGKV